MALRHQLAALEHGLGQREIIRVGHLEILRAAGHQQRPVAQASMALASSVTARAGALQRLHQQADAEHLRRLRQPLVLAVQRRRDAAAFLPLERVGQLVRQQAAHLVLRAGVDQRVDQRRRDQAARGVVHQHPVLVGGAHAGELVQAVGDAGGAGRAAAGHHHGRGRVALEEAVARRHHHQRPGDALHGREGRQRVPDHRLAGDALVLLGAGRAGAAAGAGAGNQGVKAGIGFAFTGCHSVHSRIEPHTPPSSGAGCFVFFCRRAAPRQKAPPRGAAKRGGQHCSWIYPNSAPANATPCPARPARPTPCCWPGWRNGRRPSAGSRPSSPPMPPMRSA